MVMSLVIEKQTSVLAG